MGLRQREGREGVDSGCVVCTCIQSLNIDSSHFFLMGSRVVDATASSGRRLVDVD